MADGRSFEMVLGNSGLETQVHARPQRVEFVHDFEPRFLAEMVNARDVEQEIKPELLLAGLAHSIDLLRGYRQAGFPSEFRFLEDLEPLLQCNHNLVEVHEKTSKSSLF